MKKIIVIGASSGLGLKIASDFARLGWKVGLAARRDEPMAAVKALYPDRVNYLTMDVTSQDAVDKLHTLIDMTGGMDILLYAAGTGWYNPELESARDEQTIAVNVVGFTRIVNAAYRYFASRGSGAPRGRIAAITSIGGTKGIGISATYSASKRYQWTYLEAIDQLAHRRHVNVAVTDIRPGFVATALLPRGAASRYPMVMSVDYAAPRIERAILEGRRVETIDLRWGIVSALWKLVPGCLWRHLSLDFMED